MNPSLWFYSDTQQTYGPIAAPQLIAMIQAGQLVGGHFIMPQGAQEWQLLSTSPFAGYLPKAAPSEPALPPPPQSAPQPPQRVPGQPFRPPQQKRTVVQAAPPKKKEMPVRILALMVILSGGLGFWLYQMKAKGLHIPDPISRFSFNSRAPEPGAKLYHAPIHDGVLELDGSYMGGREDKTTGSVCRFFTPDLNYNAFTLVVRLRPDDIATHWALLTCGGHTRWIGLHVLPTGELVFRMKNGKFKQTVQGVNIKAGEWLTLAVSLDIKARQVVVYVNGKNTEKISLPVDFKFNDLDPYAKSNENYYKQWESKYNKEWMFEDHSNLGRFIGAVDELIIYGSVLTEPQVAQLSQSLERAVPKQAPARNEVNPAVAVQPTFTNSFGMKFVPVPGTNALICIHETRKQDFAAYAESDPNVHTRWKNPEAEVYGKKVAVSTENDHPVVCMSGEDAEGFCAWLSKKDGRTYRLPTNREWCLAAGIPEDPNAREDDYTNLTQWDEWRKEQMKTNTTLPVMSWKPNQLGVYDMAGNVQELCADDLPESKTVNDERIYTPGTKSGYRLLRGGYFKRRSFELGGVHSSSHYSSCGFRCVLEPAR